MQVIIAFMMLAAVVAAVIGSAVAYFNSSAGKYKRELATANERVSIAQTALIEIASGDAMPVLRATEALGSITRSYTKGITQ